MKQFFKNLGLKVKLSIGFAIILLLVIVSNGYSFIALNQMNSDLDVILNEEMSLLVLDERISQNMVDRTNLLQGYIISNDKRYRDKFDEGLEESIALENAILENTNSQKVKDLLDKKIEWGTLTNQVFKEWDNGNKEKAVEILTAEVQPLEIELKNGFNEMASTRETKVKEMGSTIQENGSQIVLNGIIITVIAIILGGIIAIFTANLIVNPVKKVMNRMVKIGDGYLNEEPLEITSEDEIGKLSSSMNDLQERLKDVLREISTVSETVASHSEELTQSASEVASGSEQISATMQELASGSEQQASHSTALASLASSFTTKVEEANAYGKEIEFSSNDVLEMTKNGQEMMNSSSDQMERIQSVMSDVVLEVQTLHQKSQEINKLVTVINDVADQTNLLSLNASIEAARAGEAGKGFAVVANEVKKLSGETAQSVKDITKIVEDIQSEFNLVIESLSNGSVEVEKGTLQIQNTNKTFTEISSAVEDMNLGIQHISANLMDITQSSMEMGESVQEIAAISEESSAGIEETSAATEQTGSSMEEVRGSSENLAVLAGQLNEMVHKFKLS